MFEDICKRELCTGCAACASVCPKNSIEMKSDEEGFLRPAVNNALCIHCNLCRKTCPINKDNSDDGIQPQVFAARIKDKDLRARSSSGGIFSSLAKRVLEGNGAVIAAGFDEKLQVVHKVCTDITDLDELRRSKYVQSRIGTAYRQAKALLENGQQVLFCGTSCQIAGIKAYLGKEYDKLYTVDFICHGTPSPLAYNRYLEYLKEKYKSEISTVNFRSKSRGWRMHSLCVQFANGIEHNESVSHDYYMRSFIMDMNLRQSCFQCAFKSIHRQADITIADFWGVEYVMKDWDDDTGVSVVFLHSDKGTRLFDSCMDELEIQEISIADAIAHNPSMIKSVKRPPLRDRFMKDVGKLRYDKLHDKYCGSNITSRLRRKLSTFKVDSWLKC